MKKTQILIYSIVCLLGLSGCLVKSINPFYTQETSIENPKEIEGKWKAIKSRGEDISVKESITIKIKGQEWIFAEKGKSPIFFDVHIFKVEGQNYIDFVLNEHRHKLDDFNDYIQLTHGLFKLDLKEETLVLTPINQKWLTDYIKINPSLGTIEGEGEFNNILLTASSKELVKALKSMTGNEAVFPVTEQLVFKKV